MCDPVTLAVAAGVVSGAGTAFSGYAQSKEQKYAAQVASNNATMAQGQAADAVDRGKRDELRKWREIAQTKSAQLAAASANGLDPSFGSAADVMVDTAVFGAEDARLIREGSEREATGFLISAQNYREESKAQRRAAKNTMLSTAFKLAGTALGTAGQVAGMSSPGASGSTGGFGRSSWGGSSAPNSAFAGMG